MIRNSRSTSLGGLHTILTSLMFLTQCSEPDYVETNRHHHFVPPRMQRKVQLPKCYGLLLVFFFQVLESPGDRSFTLDLEGIDYQVVMHALFLPEPMKVGHVQWCL